ncbi:hypothetical protein CDAR_51381 [Caerostris darwini]|uniref:Uncharacterized protein n=1 Tax=Caerostris darwini TaxID=1538125 RepID=A0AAV4U5Z0_9ARAC|nr:hypothetical protein CDAR_51381 [Caerostris darwini]
MSFSPRARMPGHYAGHCWPVRGTANGMAESEMSQGGVDRVEKKDENKLESVRGIMNTTFIKDCTPETFGDKGAVLYDTVGRSAVTRGKFNFYWELHSFARTRRIRVAMSFSLGHYAGHCWSVRWTANGMAESEMSQGGFDYV